jgi:hypothetical protein
LAGARPGAAEDPERLASHPAILAALPPSSPRLQSSQSNDPPSLADDSPRLADEPPGLADEPPRLANEPPGLADEPPGLADDSPGLANDSPRLADEPPGLADDSPGLADEPPGLADDPPGLADDPPGLADDSPDLEDDSPGPVGLLADRPLLAGERLIVLDRLEGRALGIDVRLDPARQRVGDGDRRLHVGQASREEPEVASGRARVDHLEHGLDVRSGEEPEVPGVVGEPDGGGIARCAVPRLPAGLHLEAVGGEAGRRLRAEGDVDRRPDARRARIARIPHRVRRADAEEVERIGRQVPDDGRGDVGADRADLHEVRKLGPRLDQEGGLGRRVVDPGERDPRAGHHRRVEPGRRRGLGAAPWALAPAEVRKGSPIAARAPADAAMMGAAPALALRRGREGEGDQDGEDREEQELAHGVSRSTRTGPLRSCWLPSFFNRRERPESGGSAPRHGRRWRGRRTIASAVSLVLSSVWPWTPHLNGRGCFVLKGRALTSLAL